MIDNANSWKVSLVYSSFDFLGVLWYVFRSIGRRYIGGDVRRGDGNADQDYICNPAVQLSSQVSTYTSFYRSAFTMLKFGT